MARILYVPAHKESLVDGPLVDGSFYIEFRNASFLNAIMTQCGNNEIFILTNLFFKNSV